MKFEIFKTGTHTSDKGISKEYSLEDLNFIAQSYKPEEDEAPIVIGHPEDNDPAFGWVNSLSVSEDGKLIAEASDEKLQPDFLNALKEGRYKKRSISLTPEGKLRHIGFLGAAKPAIKGLADIQFSSPSSVVYEFEYSEDNSTKEKEPDKLSELTQEINSLKETISSLQKNFSESELNSTKASIDKITSQLNSLQSKISNSDFENLLDEKVEVGTLTPAIKDKVLELSNFMQSQNFSDGFSSSKFHGDVNNLLMSLVNSFPKIIYYDNFAEKPEDDTSLKDDSFIGMEIDAESKQLHKKALGLMKKQNISYLSAVTKLIHN
ncbi:MAG: hypothetical protein B6D44_10260 [Ignavibacteriales bacterium UTCHB2]|jgi:hypothetical protein|nr:MAG: hypothetical protein B6D44_10260 [Ignavibacteriales bacterium UTCHB2]